MEFQPTSPRDARMPADYFRRESARVRRLAADATTSLVKARLQDIAGEYDRLARDAWEPRNEPADKPV